RNPAKEYVPPRARLHKRVDIPSRRRSPGPQGLRRITDATAETDAIDAYCRELRGGQLPIARNRRLIPGGNTLNYSFSLLVGEIDLRSFQTFLQVRRLGRRLKPSCLLQHAE